jgi:hypothetical protein
MSVNFMELVNILFRKMERNGMSAVMLTKGIWDTLNFNLTTEIIK